MVDHSGPGAGALAAARTELTLRHAGAADADRILAEIICGAHAATVQGIDRLGAIAADIADAAQGGYPTDTALAAREFQRYLVAKQREVHAVIAEAHRLDDAGRTRMTSLVYPG